MSKFSKYRVYYPIETIGSNIYKINNFYTYGTEKGLYKIMLREAELQI